MWHQTRDEASFSFLMFGHGSGSHSYLDNILVQEIELKDAEGPSSSTPKITVSARLGTDTREAASRDDVELTIDYKLLHDTLANAVNPPDTPFGSLGKCLSDAAFSAFPRLPWLQLEVRSKEQDCTFGYRANYRAFPSIVEEGELFIQDLKTRALIGVYDWERKAKQDVEFGINVSISPKTLRSSTIHLVIGRLMRVVEASSFFTLEALASEVAGCVIQGFNRKDRLAQTARVRVKKPQALPSGVATVELVRGADQCQPSPPAEIGHSNNAQSSLAVLSIGSNISPRFEYIEKALQLLEEDSSVVRILDSSFMYDTTPMYVADQDRFANCALLIESSLTPLGLLDHVKKVEEQVGRVATFRHGPRVVDLDIVFYDQTVMDNTSSSENDDPDRGGEKGDLIIPHPRCEEREFVLRPVADILPTFIHPTSQLSVSELLERVADKTVPLQRVLPLLPRGRVGYPIERSWTWGDQTYLMGILNATPDSFSDGGQHFELNDAMEYARRCVHESTDIIDIGGYSTRPGALEISPEEEIRRVSSVVQHIRSEGIQIPISVDTFRASVAQAAIRVGADMINDVYALAHDPEIRETARQLGVPVVLMHSRGDAGKNKDYEGSVVDVVREELGAKVKKALESGIRRWNIIVDPGIGFSKSVEDNCTLLREHSALTTSHALSSMPPRHRTLREAWEANKKTPMRNMPTLVGSSRKSFLGNLLGQGNSAPVPARERGWATAATISAAIQQGSDIIRVHDVKEMRQVKIVADAIWRAAKRVL